MKQKKILSILFILLFCSITSMSQAKKEITTEKIDIRQDSSITKITKPQKSNTQGSVMLRVNEVH